mmetsp:Transcript_28664/g.85652  ORF Transcript_28664/g.85652 Transcript_28664/m.85652 type:complete len:373 (-) Transcript_28664:14-1132(-)
MGELAIARGCQVLLVGLRTASLNNSIGLVVSGPTGPDRRYGVDLDGGRPKAIKQANLVLVDDGVGRPSAWDAIRHSPPLAREETCDMLCKNLVPIVLPELAQTDSIVLPFDSDIARGYNGRPWPRQATRRLVWVQLDAACHHCLLEWLGKDQGWRVFQSNVECYTAGAWASPLGNELHKTNQLGEQGFIDGGDAHARFGAGRLLDDKGISEYWRRLLHLRRVSDDVVKDVLLPQCPVDLSSLTPASERAPVLRAWNEKAIAVQNWAVGWLDKAEGGLGCTGVPTPDTFDIYVGRDRLFRVPNDSYKALCLAFIEVTGDRILNFIFLRLLNYIGYARRPFPCPDYETSGATTRMGFAVQAICGGDTPMEPRML